MFMNHINAKDTQNIGMNIIQLLQRQKGINMQERTLSQEIVKQCMIQERYNALWGYDTEKGIEKTEKNY